MVAPPAEVCLFVMGVALVVAFVSYFASHKRRLAQHAPLRSLTVADGEASITGITSRKSFNCPDTAQRYLRALVRTRAVLLRSRPGHWVVLGGADLTVQPVATGTQSLSYIPCNAPRIAATTPSATLPLPTEATTLTTADADLEALDVGYIDVSAIVSRYPIQRAATLADAKRLIPANHRDTATERWCIVRGSAGHPRIDPTFYVLVLNPQHLGRSPPRPGSVVLARRRPAAET